MSQRKIKNKGSKTPRTRELTPQEILRQTLALKRQQENARVRGRLVHMLNSKLFKFESLGNHEYLNNIAEILTNDLKTKVTRAKVQKQAARLQREIQKIAREKIKKQEAEKEKTQ